VGWRDVLACLRFLESSKNFRQSLELLSEVLEAQTVLILFSYELCYNHLSLNQTLIQ
jgi:hypothetical protein